MFSFFKNKINYLLIFLFAFLFFSFLQSPQVLPDPDAFYHAKISQYLGQGKILKEFPYLQYTTLNDGFADHHFLYHLLLVPFVKIFGPLAGVKLGQAFLTAFFVLIFYWFLKKEKIKWPLLWTSALVLNSPFIFRTLLIKANSLSLIILFLSIYFIFNKKYLFLFILSYLYVLSYGGWVLIFIAVGAYLFAKIIDNIFLPKNKLQFKKFLSQLNFLPILKREKTIFKNKKLRIVLSVFGGILFGLIVNPYFPKNLYFYYQQIIQIGVINYGDKINVGGEWGSYPLAELLGSSGIVFILFFLGILFFVTSIKKQNYKSFVFLFLSIFFLGATLKSKRYVEYLIPFLIFFSGFSLTLFLKDKIGEDVRLWILDFYIRKKLFAVAFIFIFSFAAFFIIFKDIEITKRDLSTGLNFSLYEKSAEFLKDNSDAGDVIFHADWDDFPMLFYYNDKNYYIVGLDPTFMYNFDRNLYWEYANITMGIERDDLHKKIKNNFGAAYVFLDNRHLNFNDNLIRNPGFEFLYKDSEALIYKVK